MQSVPELSVGGAKLTYPPQLYTPHVVAAFRFLMLKKAQTDIVDVQLFLKPPKSLVLKD
jgi:hypothetical protein